MGNEGDYMRETIYNHIKKHIHRLDIDYEKAIVNNRIIKVDDYDEENVKLGYKYVRLKNVIGFIKWGEEAIDMNIKHIDGDKWNNKPCNLELVNPRKEIDYTIVEPKRKRSAGNKHPSTKLTESEVLEIRRLVLEGVKQTVLAERYKVAKDTISKIHTRKCWRHI